MIWNYDEIIDNKIMQGDIKVLIFPFFNSLQTNFFFDNIHLFLIERLENKQLIESRFINLFYPFIYFFTQKTT